jgi:hypothetical protein
MIQVNQEALKPLASKYIWWKTPDEALTMPERVIAQVMDTGDYADVQLPASPIGDEALREVLAYAEPVSSTSVPGHTGTTVLG